MQEQETQRTVVTNVGEVEKSLRRIGIVKWRAKTSGKNELRNLAKKPKSEH